jgi:glucan phosphorylase
MAQLDALIPRTRIAYFSMEIALHPEMHTYSGGLGVLAGDTARSCADLEMPVVFVTLLSRAGYLRQEIDSEGRQIDAPDPWQLDDEGGDQQDRVLLQQPAHDAPLRQRSVHPLSLPTRGFCRRAAPVPAAFSP